MKHSRLLFIIALTAFISLTMTAVSPAQAFANATVTSRGCSSFAASGSSNAPFVTLYAYSYATGKDWFVVIPTNGGKYAGEVTFPGQPQGTLMNYEVWGSLAFYTDLSDPLYWDGEGFYDVDVPCGNSSAPAIPAGYTLKTVTCDVAVFDAPGGNPIGSNRLKAGQTFYVSPTSKDAPDGEAWVQVYVSSAVNPWIPARCVN
jgi:hypothetical protein